MSTQELPAEQELINRARNGSVDAFEQLVLHYQDRLYRFLLARTANPSDAEDALQEAFVSAFKYLSSYQSRFRFSTWLFTIALRQLSRQRRQPSEPMDLIDSLACGQAGPEQLGIDKEHRSSLWHTARTCLNGAQFTALWLFYVEDMPIADIARIMKRPSGWVKVNLMRARRRLSKELQEHHFEAAVSSQEVTL